MSKFTTIFTNTSIISISFDFITIKTMGSYAEIILDLQYGKVNAALCDEGIEPMVKKIPNLQILHVPIGAFESRGHGIAISRKNAALAAQVEIAIAQLNYHIGNFAQNTSKIIDCITKSKQEGADLVVFSELSITGYYPHDLLERKEFIEQS